LKDELIFTDNSALSEDNSNYIFLAEDDLDDQEFFIDSFREVTQDVKILTVANGSKAVKVLESLPLDKLPLLIILDYNLPELNGADILRLLQFKELFKSIPKVVWSTSTTPVYEEICMKLGAQAYIVKPSKVEEIDLLAQKMYALCIR
jgi:CheY-like chemotaxis protein